MSRRMMVSLAICMALQMTSFVMVLPLYARRFAALGGGVAALGASSTAYALAATLAAPFMGALADRIGRRPLILASLVVWVFAFTGYWLASSVLLFIVLRGVAGALTAGLMPAATGMVADLAPETRRAQWIGVLSGGASFGWIAGPVLGGLLYDQWGYGTALLVCIGMAVVALLLAALTIRETSARPQPRQAGASLRRSLHEMRAALPLSLRPMLVALAVYFAVMFAWAFIEPRFMFFAYDDLAWSSSMLGAVMSTYGVALMLGEFGLARLSDRLGRRPVIIAGLVLFSAQFIGLALFRNYVLIAIAFVIAGLGNALFDPALTASLLDSTPAANRAGVLGLKSTVGSVGSILGPALAMAFTSLLSAQGIFFGAAGVVYVMVWIAAVAGRAPRPAEPLAHSA